MHTNAIPKLTALTSVSSLARLFNARLSVSKSAQPLFVRHDGNSWKKSKEIGFTMRVGVFDFERQLRLHLHSNQIELTKTQALICAQTFLLLEAIETFALLDFDSVYSRLSRIARLIASHAIICQWFECSLNCRDSRWSHARRFQLERQIAKSLRICSSDRSSKYRQTSRKPYADPQLAGSSNWILQLGLNLYHLQREFQEQFTLMNGVSARWRLIVLWKHCSAVRSVTVR